MTAMCDICEAQVHEASLSFIEVVELVEGLGTTREVYRACPPCVDHYSQVKEES